MSKFLKKILCITLGVILSFSLSSCKNSSNGEYYGDYHDGYVDGYSKGVTEAQRQISYYAEECFNDINVEDAMQILTNYADGEPISEEELHDAIWAIHEFYYEAWDVIFEIEDYTID